ncbi:MAG TPA: proline--tRNA ligase [Acidimicrobiales bacterium]
MAKGENSDSKQKGALTPRSEDFPQWYQDVVARAELAENGPAAGTMVIRPWGYGIWELFVAEIDKRIKEAGAENAYFPLFIPESFLKLEAEHVEGFAPELAIVTHGGGKELEEPLVVRPTSETVINSLFSKWIQSYRDLPYCINQWANVVRWEMRPRLFLRSREFLWQEGHTAHATEADARDYALKILRDVYQSTSVEVAAMPVLTGHKTRRERFAGAICTWAIEAMMGDGKALQMGTSHELGQNFARPFDIKFQSKEGAQEYVWQTSWGSSTRLIGGLIMGHGDDFGLRLPSTLAPTQVVVMMIKDDDAVASAAGSLVNELRAAGHRVRLDDRTDTSFGRRSVDWELKGVPVRVEVGPRDLAEGNVTVVTRHTREKQNVALGAVADTVAAILKTVGPDLLAEATAARDAKTVSAASFEEATEAGSVGFARVPLEALGPDGEDRLAQHALSIRCLQRPDGSLALPGQPQGDLVAVVARSY